MEYFSEEEKALLLEISQSFSPQTLDKINNMINEIQKPPLKNSLINYSTIQSILSSTNITRNSNSIHIKK